MSRTDKNRPWCVQLVDAPGTACKPEHDHRRGPCTLTAQIKPERLPYAARRRGCHWTGTEAWNMRRCESHGAPEWNRFRRDERHRDRRAARRRLRNWNGDD